MSLKINVKYSPVSSGLVLLLDADNKNSYSGTGTTWYDLSGNSKHFTITTGLTWDDSGFFNLTDTGAASITGGITAATGCTVGFYIKSTDTQSLFLSNTSTAYLGA